MSETAVANWAGVLQPADKELSNPEILSRYGEFITRGLHAFRSDPQYLVEIAEQAAHARYLRARKEARSTASKQTKDPSEVETLTQQILSEQGITEPVARRSAA